MPPIVNIIAQFAICAAVIVFAGHRHDRNCDRRFHRARVRNGTPSWEAIGIIAVCVLTLALLAT